MIYLRISHNMPKYIIPVQSNDKIQNNFQDTRNNGFAGKLANIPENKEIKAILLQANGDDKEEENKNAAGSQKPKRPKLILYDHHTGTEIAPSTPTEHLIMGLLQAPT